MEKKFLNLRVLDHSPILIEYRVVGNSNPRPFKLFNTVLQHPEFSGLVRAAWAKPCNDTHMYRLWVKLKILKLEVKSLNTYLASYKKRLKYNREKLNIV